jgi:hypothetical protein
MNRRIVVLALFFPVIAAGQTAKAPPASAQSTAAPASAPTPRPELFATSINNVMFADQFPGADASEKIQNAINALPPNGGTVDARNLDDHSGAASTVIDAGPRAVTLLLGPYTYTIRQIVLRSSFKIHGLGEGQSFDSAPATLLQSCRACANLDAMVLPTVGQPIQGVELDHFRLYPAAGNISQHGFNFASTARGGIWSSEFHDLCVGACKPDAEMFRGGDIVLDGTADGGSGVDQFLNFKNVQSPRSAGGRGYGLLIKGNVGQVSFDNCEFDGPVIGDNGTNIWIGDGVAGLSLMPNTIHFMELTCQMAGVCASLNGSWNVTFDHSHIENTHGTFLLNAGATNGNVNVGILNSYIATSGNNSGDGYIVKVASPPNRASVNFSGNYVESTPDHLFAGSVLSINGINNFGMGGNVNANISSANRIASTLQVSSVQSNIGANLTAKDIVLDVHWGESPFISDLAPQSTGQTAAFTIHVGSGSVSANPTLTVKFPIGFNTAPICTLDQHGGTQTNTNVFFAQSNASATSTGFMFQGTPQASATINVVMRCGP